ncbi:hypothetical protein ABPG74_017968 [Tetrahymena malaccensis]
MSKTANSVKVDSTKKDTQTTQGQTAPTQQNQKAVVRETIWLVAGIFCTIISSPVIFLVILSTLWDLIDRGFRGTNGTGIIFIISRWINTKTEKFNQKFVAYKEDAYTINVIILLAVVLPIAFLYCLNDHMNNGFSWTLCILYNLFRLGPYLINFTWCYALSHKEGHMGAGLYKEPYTFLSKIFNWWIGLFYGVLPASFVYGHSINHHKYDNREEDVVSTSDRPRDSWLNWIRYIPRFALYSLNVSTIIQFYKERKYGICLKMFLGSVYWFSFVFLVLKLTNSSFTFWYVIYPFFENFFILSAINWAWHAFIDDQDPENEYINSVTIVDGVFNVLNEDYHVVHHQYPGVHWTKNYDLYLKHKEEYKKGKQAAMFKDTQVFEMFVLVASANYDVLAQKMVLNQELSFEEKKEFIKRRLRVCTWGPFKTVDQKISKWE